MKKFLCLCIAGISILTVNITSFANENNNTSSNISEEISEYDLSDSDVMPLVGVKYRVVANNVNVRKSPSTSATILGQMNWGDVCYEINPPEVHNGQTWVYVRCGSPLTNVKGYILYDYLEEDGY